MTTIFSLGNTKLPPSTAIFSLPVFLTCPNTTKMCQRYCYAKIAEARFPNVKKHRNASYLLSLKKSFSKIIISQIKKLKKKVVRIHESGDFYSQNYFNKWVTIAKTLPDVLFYTYTRVDTLNLKNKPSNLIVRLSLDNESIHLLQKANSFDGFAYVLEHEPSRGFYRCPGSCKKCTYCLHKGNVEFLKH